MPSPTGEVRDINKDAMGGTLEYDSQNMRFINGGFMLVRPPTVTDHFLYGAGALNSHVPQYWVTTETGAATPFAPNTGNIGGTLVGVTGATTNNAEEVAGKGVFWECDVQAPWRALFLEVRAKFVGATTPADGDFYIGWSNVVTATSGLAYVVSATSTITSTGVAEGAFVGYSSIPTSGALFNASGNNFLAAFSTTASAGSVKATVPAPSIAKDSAFHIFNVNLDALGNASYWVDGVWIGSVATALNKTTKLTPYIGAVCKNSHAQTATIDYVCVSGDLV